MRGWFVLGCACMLGFSSMAATLAVSPLLGIILADLALTHGVAGALFSTPLATLAALSVLGGFLSDRVGIRKAAGLGAVLINIGSFFRASSFDFMTLLASNALVGAGWGLAFPSFPKLVSNWFPKSLVGTATGIYTTGITAGAAVAIATTLPIMHSVGGGWHDALYFWFFITLVATTIWWLTAREQPHVTSIDKSTVQHERQGGYIELLKNRYLWCIGVLLLVGANAVYYGSLSWFPSYFTTRGLTAVDGAYLTSVAVIVQLPFLFLLPIMSDRVGARKPFYLAAAALVAMAYPLLMFTPNHAMLPLMLAIGASSALMFVFPLMWITDLIPSQLAGRASGMILTIGYTGGFVGPLLGGYVIEITSEYTTLFIMFAMFCIASALVCAATIPETGRSARLRRWQPTRNAAWKQ